MLVSRSSWLGFLGLTAAVLLGSVLRLIWVDDMEYKTDEAWTFLHTQLSDPAEPSIWLGMPSSAHFRNPGMSLWVFQVLSKLGGVHEPTELARIVQLLGIAAMLLLIAFAWRCVALPEREAWLWAVALLAVNPIAVLFERKIWPPSVLPIFISALLICWWRRERPLAAFGWGILGACLGQIHMGGFFFAAAFVTWGFFFDRKRIAWLGWLTGSCLGALPLIPWIAYLCTKGSGNSGPDWRWYHVLEFRFLARWGTEPIGLGLSHSLAEDFSAFLGWPLLDGRPTYLVGLLHLLVIAIGGAVLLPAALRFGRAALSSWRAGEEAQNRGLAGETMQASAPPSHSSLGKLVSLMRKYFVPSPDRETAFTQSAAFWGFGLLITFSFLPIHRHYMIIAHPFEILWLVRLALRGTARPRLGRALLVTLCAAQFFITASFLSYIHVHQGSRGDYGVTYRSQAH